MRSARKRALAIVTALAMLLAEPCMALHAEPAEAAGMTAEAGSITERPLSPQQSWGE